jgi:hypothetical protein
VIRDYRPEDNEALRRIHAEQGIDYDYQSINLLDKQGNDTGVKNPLFFVVKVREVDGKVHSAMVLKLCAETFLLQGDGRPQDKMTAMQELQQAVLTEAYERGLDEIHASVPAIGFDKRLVQLGWLRDRLGWNLWSRRTDAISE